MMTHRARRGNAPFLISLASAIALALASRYASGYLEIPARSPRGQVSQRVGLTDIAVEYNSPAVRGRGIWGAAVPYGQLWRTGDSPTATISFSREVDLAGQRVPPGSYALGAIPGPQEWTLVLNRSNLEVARVALRVEPIAHRERLTFLFADFSDERASLDLEWEKVRIAIPIKVHTREQILAGIDALDSVWREYANLARYMLERKGDYDAGLRYIDKSLALAEHSQNLWIKASLLAAKRRYAEAYQQGSRAYETAEKLQEAEQFEMSKRLSEWDRAAGDRAGRALARKKSDEIEPPQITLEPPRVALASLDDSPARRRRADQDDEEKTTSATRAKAPSASPVPEREIPTLAILAERPAPSYESHRSIGPAASEAPSPAAISAIIARGRSDIQACYQRALRLDPSLQRGKISVSVSVGVSGMVTSVILDSPRQFRALEPCIKKAVSHWVFPPSPKEYGAELPFVLHGGN